ncbi:MAG: hypothetical protein E7672_06940 [Ruminococcaceae bacterium]|nr:hypothetical protein [Oscillospiraceae bacterium]
MRDISEIDENFKIEKTIERDGKTFYNVLYPPFKVHGVIHENGKFRRIPESVAKATSPGVYSLHANGAGGRVRFRTNSKSIAIIAKISNIGKMEHFAFTGSSGFDLYVNDVFYYIYVPYYAMTDTLESNIPILNFGKFDGVNDITINFPLYTDVDELYVGVENGSIVEEPTPYRVEAPVVYYGSSITQGGCASRPGTSYQSIISRRFDCDYINLGFSGNAKAEDPMIEHIKSLDMSMFVLDYDHNAPTVEHLANTHEKMFKAIRSAHPDMPIVMMSRPKARLNDEEIMRRSIIETTYNNALACGDKNVYFLDGAALTELCGNDGTVDNCHPTDFGFASMAKALGDLIEKHQLL